ncbi:uncharacterized protein LOC132958901 [Labrus mixtus]|uniref:uncharacterized protein LOC132958901 n=1 Tax=Labrus mixtus TaxID=508554 RepID=UPI0029C04A37|nr:uncharacterized protein LOC132958901 [Labrus mixtus]
MGVRNSLPMEGVDVILGNDLSGARVWKDDPPSLVSEVGAKQGGNDESVNVSRSKPVCIVAKPVTVPSEDFVVPSEQIVTDTPSRTNLVQHDIDVGDAKPIQQRFYRVPIEKRRRMEKEVDYMVQNGIAEPASSHWASPCLLVPNMFDITYRNRISDIKHPSSLPYCSLFCCSLQNYGHFKATVIRTTMNHGLIKAFLLCSLSWISVSGSESQTVEVQSGDDVTLMCSGMDEIVRVRYWLKVVKGTNIQCVSTMASHISEVTYRDGYSNHKFTMWSNTSTIFLKVRSVELNDSGVYYCGFNKHGRPFLTTIHLKIKGSNESDEDVDRTDSNHTSMILLLFL